jgi:hypothetical protein
MPIVNYPLQFFALKCMYQSIWLPTIKEPKSKGFWLTTKMNHVNIMLPKPVMDSCKSSFLLMVVASHPMTLVAHSMFIFFHILGVQSMSCIECVR